MSANPLAWKPNWAGGVRERCEWLTDIIRVRSGEEQRIRLRAVPRLSWDYTLAAAGDRGRSIAAAVSASLGVALDLPLWADVTPLRTAALAGATSLDCDTEARAFVGPGRLVLRKDPEWAILEVAAVPSADALTLAAPLAVGWPAGTQVYPLRRAILSDAVQRTARAPDVAQWHLLFAQTEDTDPWAAADGAARYQGLPVWTSRPNWRDGLATTAAHPLALVDGLSGARAWYRIGEHSTLGSRHDYTTLTRAALATLRRALYARAGRVAGCWLPSYTQDVRLTAIAPLGTRTLTIAAAGYAGGLAGDAEHQHMQIVLHDGTVLYAQVDGAAAVSAQTERLTLAAGLTRRLRPGDVRRLSWLRWSRLGADQIEILYRTPTVAELTVPWEYAALRQERTMLVPALDASRLAESLTSSAPAAPSGSLRWVLPATLAQTERLFSGWPTTPTGSLTT